MDTRKFSLHGGVRLQRILGLLVFALLLSMAAPAFAGVNVPGVTPDNTTVYATSDYTVALSTSGGMSVGDDVYLDFSNAFDVSGLDLDQITMLVSGDIYQAAAYREGTGSVVVTVPVDVAAGQNASLILPGIKNASVIGEQWFGDVSVSSEPDIASAYVDLTAPELVITPDFTTMEVYLRNKLTVALEDSEGQPLIAPYYVNIRNFTDGNAGEFYPDYANTYQINYYNGVNISPGESSVEVYYRPVTVGEMTVTAATPSSCFGGLSAESPVVNVTPAEPVASELYLYNLTGDLTAGEPGKFAVEVAKTDQYGNPVEHGEITVSLTAAQTDGQAAYGKFYRADESGAVTAEEITGVTIPAGEDIAYFYYADTKSTVGTGYDVELEATAVEMEAWTGAAAGITVKPAAAEKAALEVYDYGGYGRRVANYYYNNWQIAGPGGVQHNLLVGDDYRVKVGLQDEFGNYVPQDAPVTLNLSADAGLQGKFYAEQYRESPITQVTLSGGECIKEVYFAPDGVADGKIYAGAGGLGEGSFAVSSGTFDRLAVHFRLVRQEGSEFEDNGFKPSQRKEVCIMLADDIGHPAIATSDVNVNLSALNGTTAAGAFYLDCESADPVTEVTIPKDYAGVVVYYQAPDIEGEIELIAEAADPAAGLTGDTAIAEVKTQPYWRPVYLPRGWNTLSTPVLLARDRIDQVIADVAKVDIVYVYSNTDFRWHQVYEDNSSGSGYRIMTGSNPDSTVDLEFRVKPLEATYVKMKGDSKAYFYPANYVSTPPTRDLTAGWNLISPAIDVMDDEEMPADMVLSSLNDTGEYSQVVSPGLGCQESWVYVPAGDDLGEDPYEEYEPLMEAGRGYWVYVTEPGTLAGFSYTPVSDYY